MLKQCRTCTCHLLEDNPKHFKDTITINNTNVKLFEILSVCTSVQVTDEDLLPKNICSVCTDKISASYLFKQMCEESQKILLQNACKVEQIYLERGDACFDKDFLYSNENSVSEDDTDIIDIKECVKQCKSINESSVINTSDIKINIGACKDNSSILITRDSKKCKKADVVVEINSKEEKLQCEHCPNYYYNKKSFERHQKRNHIVQPKETSSIMKTKYNCDKCSHISDTRIDYISHMKKVHKYNVENVKGFTLNPITNKYHCAHCDLQYVNKSSCYHHMKIHEWSQNHKTIVTTSSDKKKVTTATDKESYYNYDDVCIECCEKYSTNILLKEHEQLHDLYTCRICNREFKESTKLKEHLKFHQDFEYISYLTTISEWSKTDPTLTAVHNKSYECKKCDLSFPTLGQVNIHEKCHPPYICQHCGVIFNHANILDNHVKKVHSKSELICKPCVECNQVFNTPDTLRIHYNQHKEFTCKTCSMKFKAPSQLCYHTLYDCKFLSDLVYRCNCCNKQFSNREVFSEHCNKHVDQCCQYCGFKLSENSISKHMRHHMTPKVGFMCFVSFCKELFESSSRLDEHLGRHDVFTCGDCKVVFKCLEELRVHYFGKLCPNATDCKECGIRYSNREELNSHYKLHSTEEISGMDEKLELNDDVLFKDISTRFKCKLCYEVFSNLNNLQLHEKEEHFYRENSLTCPYCTYVGNNSALLTQHMHGEHSHYKTWFCTECDKGFFTKDSLRVHSNRSHNGGAKHICDICGRSYINARNLSVHMRNHTGEKPYRCEICGKAFRQNNSFKYHLLSHSGQRDFQCDICGKAFHIRTHMVAHKRTHVTGGGKYKCQVCDKRYHDNYRLKIHLTLHTGEKNFLCKVCGKAFTRKKSLTIHSRTHTGEKPYPCTICEKRFSQGHVLRSHMKTHGVISKPA